MDSIIMCKACKPKSWGVSQQHFSMPPIPETEEPCQLANIETEELIIGGIDQSPQSGLYPYYFQVDGWLVHEEIPRPDDFGEYIGFTLSRLVKGSHPDGAGWTTPLNVMTSKVGWLEQNDTGVRRPDPVGSPRLWAARPFLRVPGDDNIVGAGANSPREWTFGRTIVDAYINVRSDAAGVWKFGLCLVDMKPGFGWNNGTLENDYLGTDYISSASLAAGRTHQVHVQLEIDLTGLVPQQIFDSGSGYYTTNYCVALQVEAPTGTTSTNIMVVRGQLSTDLIVQFT